MINTILLVISVVIHFQSTDLFIYNDVQLAILIQLNVNIVLQALKLDLADI